MELDRDAAAAGVRRGLQALAGQEHPIAHAQLVGALDVAGEADDRRGLRIARAAIRALPALLGQARREQGEAQERPEGAERPAISAAARGSGRGRGAVASSWAVRRPKRKNHGLARRASELAWREVLATVPRDRVELARLQNAWPRLVPRHLQEVAWPAALGSGRLVLHVDDNQWLHELSYMRHDLLAKLRRACPTAGLRELRLRVGEVELVPPPEPVPEPVVPGLPREPERATIEAMEAIEDPELRDAVAAARLALGSR